MTNTITQIRNMFASMLETDTVTANGMLEIIGASFVADDDHIFGQPNFDYIERELKWYESMSLNVNDIPGGPPRIWQQVSSTANKLGHLTPGTINSNYGYLLYHHENGAQFAQVVNALMKDPYTRQAVAVYTRPSIHKDATRDGMHDFICTNAVQYLMRDGELHAIVQMRSNDAVFGYRNDVAWQMLVLDKLANELSVPVGRIVWQVGSLHIYPRHFRLVRSYIETGEHDSNV